MTKLNQHFARAEFECHCGCGFNVVDAELLQVLTALRARFGAVTINSGARCATHNKNEGGGKNSQHLLGQAADVVVQDTSSNLVAHWFENQYPDKYGIGRYIGRTHIDVRANPARWDNR